MNLVIGIFLPLFSLVAISAQGKMNSFSSSEFGAKIAKGMITLNHSCSDAEQSKRDEIKKDFNEKFRTPVEGLNIWKKLME